jgi:DNA-binding response OmpR family regulator
MNVLIAEDDLNIRLGLKDLLEAEGYQCLEAADGDAAWALFEQHRPDLVLLDIMMPGQDGYSLCRRIRQQDQQLPVIFISAKSEEIDQVLGLELGADDYIKKPFGSREVVARIRAVTRRCLARRTPCAELIAHPLEHRAVVIIQTAHQARIETECHLRSAQPCLQVLEVPAR